MGALLRAVGSWLWHRVSGEAARQVARKAGTVAIEQAAAQLPKRVSAAAARAFAQGALDAASRAAAPSFLRRFAAGTFTNVVLPAATVVAVDALTGQPDDDAALLRDVASELARDLEQMAEGNFELADAIDLANEYYGGDIEVALSVGESAAAGTPEARLLKALRNPAAFADQLCNLVRADQAYPWPAYTRVFTVPTGDGGFAGRPLGLLRYSDWLKPFPSWRDEVLIRALAEGPASTYAGHSRDWTTSGLVRPFARFGEELSVAFDALSAAADMHFCSQCSLAEGDEDAAYDLGSILSSIGGALNTFVSSPAFTTLAPLVLDVLKPKPPTGFIPAVPSPQAPSTQAGSLVSSGLIPLSGNFSPQSILDIAVQFFGKDRAFADAPEMRNRLGALVMWKLGERTRPAFLDDGNKAWTQAAIDMEQMVNDAIYHASRKTVLRNP